MTEEQLREQNRMLVALVGDLATILDEVLTALPPEFHELPNVSKSMDLTRKHQHHAPGHAEAAASTWPPRSTT